MAYDRFMIAPINTGLETDVKPWILPDDAFANLNNAYVFRGRVRKRFGSYLMGSDPNDPQLSRLRIQVDTTDGLGDASGTVPGASGAVGQMFSIGTQLFTVVTSGAANMNWTGNAIGASFNTATGAYNFTAVDFINSAVYWYPGLPVMGITNFEIEDEDINDQPTFAFDTRFAYQFTAGAWQRLGTAIWSGDNSQFFWADTAFGATASGSLLFVTNFNQPDNIKYWDGVTWTNFSPIYSGTDTIVTARIIVSFKGRVLLLNTVETVTGIPLIFGSRVRFSQVGDPTEADAFNEDIPGKGGYLDATTQEKIVTVEFLKDRLIVFFERSTWELVWNNNDTDPFRFQKINTELGCESTFSVVPFDKVTIAVGNVGIHACNGANVERIDQKIPQAVFDIHNDNGGVQRVAGIRDYYVEMVYWTFPSVDRSTDFPFTNRVLVFNYATGSWAFNQDSITAFGYYQNQSNITWATSTETWQEAIQTWGSGILQARFRQVLAGNQQGFLFVIEPDESRNAASLSITNMTVVGNTITITSINHNLQAVASPTVGDYIAIENVQGLTNVNDVIYATYSVIDANTFTVLNTDPSVVIIGTYLGGGTIARVSNINILTKQYNFYVDKGRNTYIAKVDFLVDKTTNGQVTVDSFPSYSTISLLDDGQATGALLGSSILETSPYALVPLESAQEQLWHPVYLQAEGEGIQLRIYMNDDALAIPDDTQIRNSDIAWSDFELNAITFYAMPTASRLQ